MVKHSMKEYSNFIELHFSTNEHFDKIYDGMTGGHRAALRMIYMRLVAKSTDSSNGKERWILQPNGGFAKTKIVEDWIKSPEKYEMDSSDLLKYFKASTYKAVLKIMFKEGLLHVDKFNKLSVRYPVNGKMLSLTYAIKAIKSSYRKETSLDTPDENSVESETNARQTGTSTDEEFWNK